MRKMGCAPPKPSPTTSGSGWWAHGGEPEQGGSPTAGDTSVHLVATMCWHGGTQLSPPRWLWCGEYSPSLTETEFFGDQTSFASPSSGFVSAFGTFCVLLWRQRKGNSLRSFHFLQRLNKTKHYELPLPGSRTTKHTNNIQLCTKGQSGEQGTQNHAPVSWSSFTAGSKE